MQVFQTQEIKIRTPGVFRRDVFGKDTRTVARTVARTDGIAESAPGDYPQHIEKQSRGRMTPGLRIASFLVLTATLSLIRRKEAAFLPTRYVRDS